MKPREKIFRVLQIIREKAEMSLVGAEVSYRAGEESMDLFADDEIMILNKLESEGYIEITKNYSSDYI